MFASVFANRKQTSVQETFLSRSFPFLLRSEPLIDLNKELILALFFCAFLDDIKSKSIQDSPLTLIETALC